MAYGQEFDRSGSVGPWLVTADELPPGAAGLKIESRLNGAVMQSDNTANMMFPVAETIVYATQGMTLEPGDLLRPARHPVSATRGRRRCGCARATFVKSTLKVSGYCVIRSRPSRRNAPRCIPVAPSDLIAKGSHMADRVSVVVICGSLRKNSYNGALARMAKKFAPPGMVTTPAPPFDTFPLYNLDVQTSTGIPAAVNELGAAIGAADGVLICSPEYNWSIPGVLKNAIDWLSRLNLNRSSESPSPCSQLGRPLGRLADAVPSAPIADGP